MLGVGWLLVLALPLAGIFLLSFWDKIGSLSPFIYSLLIAGLTGTIHWQRQDRAFLKKNGRPLYLILACEYQLLVLLFCSIPVLLIRFNWPGVALSHLFILALPLLTPPRKQQAISFLALSWVPLSLFEWRSGIRKNWLLLLPVYLSGLLLAKFPAAPLISILLITFPALGFYNELEHRMLLETAIKQPRFLARKWAAQASFFLLLFTPQILLFLFFHHEIWYLIIVLVVVCQLWLACAIFYKYGAYLPNRRQVDNQTPMTLLVMAVIIPFLAPALLVALILFYRKARQRLQFFFPYARD